MTTALDHVLAVIDRCIEAENDIEDRTAVVADLLLEFAGPPAKDGVNSGSDAKLKQVAVHAKKRFASRARRFGSFDYLRQLRRTAFRFPPGERSPGVPFSLLIVARDPEILREAMDQAAKNNRQCSAGFIRKFREFKHKGAGDSSNALTRLRELQRRFVEDGRFYIKAVKPCAAAVGEWAAEDRYALATAGRDLIRAVNELVWAIEPTPMQQAAE
jgi:hypothetical protein